MIAAACAAEREDLAALVLDSPVDGWSSATERYGELLGLPLPRAHGLRLRLAQWRLGVRFNDVRPAVTLPKVKGPTLAIMPTSDVLVSAAESEAIARAAEAQGELSGAWRVACSHNLALATHPAEYERRLREFLNAALAA
jgi:hypothetical protein